MHFILDASSLVSAFDVPFVSFMNMMFVFILIFSMFLIFYPMTRLVFNCHEFLSLLRKIFIIFISHKNRDVMVTAVLVSFEDDGILAMPSEPVDLNKLIGKKVIYRDYKDKEWYGQVTEIVGSFVKIKFDNNPDGLGQGVIMDILIEDA